MALGKFAALAVALAALASGGSVRADVALVCGPRASDWDAAFRSGDLRQMGIARDKVVKAKGSCPTLAARVDSAYAGAQRPVPAPRLTRSLPPPGPRPPKTLSDIEKALARHPSAARGDAAAEVAVGQMFVDGDGVTRDDARAIEWLTKAARRGNAVGQHRLGAVRYYAAKSQADYVEARTWLRRGFDQKEYAAGLLLGDIYENGRAGDPMDPKSALYFYEKAATETGDHQSYQRMGRLYYAGSGTEKNLANAVKYAKLAADKNNNLADYQLGLYYLNGEGVTASRILAIGWMRRAASAGSKQAADWLSSANLSLQSGYAGITVQPFTKDMAESLGLGDRTGAIIVDLLPNGPAALAGVAVGDIITEANGQVVQDSNDLTSAMAAAGARSSVTLIGVRGGKPISIEFRTAIRPPEAALANSTTAGSATWEEGAVTGRRAVLGGVLGEVKTTTGLGGVLVASVDAGGALPGAGVKAGDLLMRANYVTLFEPADAATEVEKSKKLGRQHMLLGILRSGRMTFFTVDLK